MTEFLPLTQPSGSQAGKRVLPSVSSLGVNSGMRISLVTVLIVVAVAFVVWKFVLKK